MTATAELDDVRAHLIQRLKELGYRVDEQKACLRDDQFNSEMARDPYGAIDYAGPVAETLLIGNTGQIRDVLNALADLDAGRYGTCKECGKQITIGRLKVMPWAQRCIECQRQLEPFVQVHR